VLFKRTKILPYNHLHLLASILKHQYSVVNCESASKINPAADWVWDRTSMYTMSRRSLELQADWHPSRERSEKIAIAKHKKLRRRKHWWNMTHRFCQLTDLIDKQSAYMLTWPGTTFRREHLGLHVEGWACAWCQLPPIDLEQVIERDDAGSLSGENSTARRVPHAWAEVDELTVGITGRMLSHTKVNWDQKRRAV